MSLSTSKTITSPLAPILVIDSGLGGLTVASALRRRLPLEPIIYFGDTARVPYGTKSPRAIICCVAEIVRYLQRYGPKHVLLACNSASAVALAELRKLFPGVSITGVVEPGARAAAQAAGKVRVPTIAVIGTQATVRSRAYEKALAKRRARARIVQKATPLLVPIIEEGRSADDPLVMLCLEQYLSPLKAHSPDVLVLGCTHYPILRGPIQEVMGPDCVVVDSADACAEDVAGQLEAHGLLWPATEAAGEEPRLRLFASDESPRMAELACRFLGEPVAEARVVPPERLDARRGGRSAGGVLFGEAPIGGRRSRERLSA